MLLVENQNQPLDITELVEGMRSSFVTWATSYVFYTLSTNVGTKWVTLPVINAIVKAFLHWTFNRVSGAVEMEIFFLNTAMRKMDQSHDYVNARKAKNEAKTDEEFERLERAEIMAFADFVRLNN